MITTNMATVHQSFHMPIADSIKLDKIRGNVPSASAVRYLFSYIFRQPESQIIAILESEKANEKITNSEV